LLIHDPTPKFKVGLMETSGLGSGNYMLVSVWL
jgi:hypothetical protein